MNKKEQLHKDLVTEYDELNKKINSLDAFINSLDFEDQVPDFIERKLLSSKRQCMRNYRDNLKARIKCTECQIKKEKNDRKALDDWMNMKGQIVNTLCGPVHLINTDEQHHCGQDAPHFDPNESQPVDLDDACCQAGSPCGRSAVNYDPNESQPVGTKPAITGESLYKLLGRQVICFLKPGESRCENCQFNPGDPEDCVKVELVGGYMLCLAPLPNSIITE